MPISFIASFFGMNFFQPTARALDPWTNLPAFVATEDARAAPPADPHHP